MQAIAPLDVVSPGDMGREVLAAWRATSDGDHGHIVAERFHINGSAPVFVVTVKLGATTLFMLADTARAAARFLDSAASDTGQHDDGAALCLLAGWLREVAQACDGGGTA